MQRNLKFENNKSYEMCDVNAIKRIIKWNFF